MPEELHEIRGVEIMRVGKWNNTVFSDQDLSDIVDAFDKVGFGVPLKLGHSSNIGEPAHGWVSRVYKRGNVLLADLKDITSDLYKRIKLRMYDHCSVEVWFDFERAGKIFRRVLKAIALLGAETPAVSGLKPLREVVNTAKGTGNCFAFTTDFRLEATTMTKLVNFTDDPNRPDLMIHNRAIQLMDAGHAKDYASACQRVIAENPDLGRAWCSFTSVME